MAKFTSAANGNWNAGATWGHAGSVQGVDYPGPGDQASIGHIVTITADQTVGQSPTQKAALTGTVSVSGNNLTGTGTLFTTELAVGDVIYIGNDVARVSTITDATHCSTIQNLANGPYGAGTSVTVSRFSIYIAGNASSQLVLAANVILTLRGNLVASTDFVGGRVNPVVINAGTGGIQFDDSGNVGQSYSIFLGDVAGYVSALKADGVSRTSQAFVRTKSGGTGRGQIGTLQQVGGGSLDCRYTTFQNLGGLQDTSLGTDYGASAPWCQPSAGGVAFVFRLNQCIVDGCSQLRMPVTTSGDATIDLYQTWWTNSVHAIPVWSTSTAFGAITTGLRRCSENVFDNHAYMDPFLDGTIQNNYFFNGAQVVNVQLDGQGTGFDSNYTQTFSKSNNHVAGSTGLSDLKNNYLLMMTPGCGIARFSVGQANVVGTQNVTGNVIECTAYNWESSPTGAVPAPGSAVVTTNIKHNVFVRPAFDSQPQSGLTDPQSNNNLLAFDHNVLITPAPSGVGTVGAIDDIAATNPAKIISCTNNIVHVVSGGGTGTVYKVNFNAGNNTANAANALLDPANCHHNVGSGLGTGISGKGYNFSGSGTPGANDVAADSLFVDLTRTFMKWSTHASGLGNALGAAFNPNTAYNVGDIVSCSTSGFLGGVTVNYRCVKAHTPSAVGAVVYPGAKSATWTITSVTPGAPATLNLLTAVTTPTGGTATLNANDWVVICRTTDQQFLGRQQIGTAAGSSITILNSYNSGLAGAGNQFVLKCWQGYWEPESEYELRRFAYKSTGYNANASKENLIAFVKGGHTPTNLAVYMASDNVSPSFGWAGALAGLVASGLAHIRRVLTRSVTRALSRSVLNIT